MRRHRRRAYEKDEKHVRATAQGLTNSDNKSFS